MANEPEEVKQEQRQAEAPGAAVEDSPRAPEDAAGNSGSEEPEIQKAEFERFNSPGLDGDQQKKLEMLLDVVLPITVELGRTRKYIKEILELERGSIIELDKMAGEPVDLYINNKKMAEGEVVVVDKHFGVRITSLINPADRIKSLGDVE
ncbi:MAG: flagellar motor switch protein FliN [Calditrichaeota bacterium]|nr:MAG: flagellar motor switch protein FliN [Calditrichota bacterium]